MLELLFNVLLQLAIVTGSASGEVKTTAKNQNVQTATQTSTTSTTTNIKIGSGGWDDKD